MQIIGLIFIFLFAKKIKPKWNGQKKEQIFTGNQTYDRNEREHDH